MIRRSSNRRPSSSVEVAYAGRHRRHDPVEEASAHRARRATAVIASVLAAAGSVMTIGAATASAATATSCGYATGGSGPEIRSACWLDLSAYSDAAARSGGQAFSVSLPGGYTAAFTVRTSDVDPSTHDGTHSVPLGGHLGAADYTGVPGNPAIYDDSAGHNQYHVELDGITVTDAAGNPVTGYAMIVADAEVTNDQNRGPESTDYTSDRPLNRIDTDEANGISDCSGGLTGVGTTEVNCSTGDRRGDIILQSTSPTTIGASTTTYAGSQAVGFAFVTTSVEAQKQINGRSKANDSFTVSTSTQAGTSLATATTGTTQTTADTGATNILALVGQTIRFTDAVTPGNGAQLSDYTQTWACTNNLAPYTSFTTAANGLSVTATPQIGDAIDCTVTNAAKTAALTISKTGPPGGTVQPGGTVSWTITVANPTGPAPSTGYIVTDTLPVEVTGGTGTVNAAAGNAAIACRSRQVTVAGVARTRVTCTDPNTLAVGDQRTITVTATAPTNYSECFFNTASVLGDNPNSVEQDSQQVQTCTVAGAATVVKVAQTADNTANSTPGTLVRYTLRVSNPGNGNLAATPVSDNLADVVDDATYNGDADNGGTPNGGSAGKPTTLNWTLPSLAAHASIDLHFSVTVDDPDVGNHTLANTCTPDCGTIITRAPHLVVTKAESPTTGTYPGGTVAYHLVATNNGPGDYTIGQPYTFSDSLANVLPDAVYDNDATGSPSLSPDGQTLTWTGALASGQSVAFDYTVTVRKPDTGPGLLRNAIVSIDHHSCPGDGCPPVITLPVARLILGKRVSTTSTTPGSVVSYAIDVSNPSDADWPATAPASLTDNAVDVLLDGTFDNDAAIGANNAGAGTAQITPTATGLTWAGPLPAHTSFTITYSVTLNNPTTGPDTTLVNTVSAAGSNCPADFTAACTTTTQVAALTGSKTASTATALPGTDVTYTVTLTNPGTGDWTTGSPASFRDNLLADVLDDATYDGTSQASWVNSPGETSSPPSAHWDGTNLTWQGALPHGETVQIVYTVHINNPDSGNRTLSNALVTNYGNCAGSGCAPVITRIPDEAITKTVSTTAAQPGDTVTYTVTVTNVGTGDFTAGQAGFDDNLATNGILDDATEVGTPTVTGPNGPSGNPPPAATFDGTSVHWHGELAAGASVVVTYTVRINTPDTGDHVLHNAVVTQYGVCIAGDPSCKSPDTGIADLHVVKRASTANASEGQVVTYTITATNSGTAPYLSPHATVDDSLTGLLDDATLTAGPTATGPVGPSGAPVPEAALTENGTNVHWDGELGAGQTVTITYSVTVNTPDTGDHQMPNTVISSGDCAAGSTDPDCGTITKNADLLVTKVASTQNAPEGTSVTYTITATNTGRGDWTVDNPAHLDDSLADVLDDASFDGRLLFTPPAGSDTANYPPAWQAATQNIHWSGPLAAGQTLVISYTVVVDTPDNGDGDMPNTVVSQGSCRTAATGCSTDTRIPKLEVTKTGTATIGHPGDVITYTITGTNDGAGDWTTGDLAHIGDDLSSVLDDATLTGPITIAGADSADRPTVTGTELTWDGALLHGHTVTITYAVTINADDTGDHTLTNVVQAPGGNCRTGNTDPACGFITHVADLRVVKTASMANASEGKVVTYTLTATNNGTADWTAPDQAVFDDSLTAVLDDATYDGDATATGPSSPAQPTFDPTSEILHWASDLPAGATATITYSVTVNTPDTGDHLMPNTVTAVGCTDPASQCSVLTRIADLATTKVADTQNSSEGNVVTYTITATNTGQGDWNDTDNKASISDDLSAVLDDATFDDDQAATGPNDPRTPDFDGTTLFWDGPLASGQTMTITYSVTVNTPDAGDHVMTNTVTAPGNCRAGSTDQACTSTTKNADLAVLKSVDVQNPVPGSVVTYTVTATNTGPGDWTDANPAHFVDDLSGLLDDATFATGTTTGDSTVDPVFTSPNLTWSSALASGGTAVITYSLTVDAPDTGDHVLPNTVVAPGNCRVGSVDPSCSVTAKVPDLHVTKVASTGNAAPLSVITYTLTAVNTGAGDWTTATPATLTDDLSQVLDDATWNNDANSAPDGTAAPAFDAATSTLSWSDALAAGATATITYSVTVNDPDTGDHLLPNTVVSNIGTGCAPSSTDPDCHVTSTVADLATAKVADTQNTFPGGTVTYTVTATNDGTGPWTAMMPALLTDDLTDVLDDATYNGDAVATGDPADAVQPPTYAAPDLTWTGPLDVGHTVTFTYSVTVNDPDTGDHDMPNTISALGNCVPDAQRLPQAHRAAAVVSDPTCTADPKVADLTVHKIASTQNPAPGSKVTYTVTATNSGKGDWTAAHPATLTDDFTAILDDAKYDNDAAVVGDAGDTPAQPAYTAPQLSWSDALAAGHTITLTYSFTVANPDTGDHRLPNTIVSVGDCETGSTNPDCSAQPLVPDLQVKKVASASQTTPGATIRYTITARNTGPGDWTTDSPATLTDDLTRILDDADYAGDATATTNAPGATVKEPTYADHTLSWSGPIPSGDTVTITYTAKVHQKDAGDHDLVNTVIAPTGNCATAGDACTVDTPEAAYTVVKTSDPATGTHVDPGRTIHYRLTIHNTGKVALAPRIVDTMTKVLDDAAYNHDASATAGTVVYVEPRLTWTGPLPVGATVVVTYSLTVKAAADQGDGKLLNVVTGNGPLTSCLNDPSLCQTSAVSTGRTDPHVPSTLSYTGTDSRDLTLLAIALLLLGALLFGFGRGGSGGTGGSGGPHGSGGPNGPAGGGGGIRRWGRRAGMGALLTVLLVVLAGCSGNNSSRQSPAAGPAHTSPSASAVTNSPAVGGSASLTVGAAKVGLAVTSCTTTKSVTQVVAQQGAAWTLQLRHDTAAATDVLVVVQHSANQVVTYQASTSAANPRGNGTTRLHMVQRGSTFTGQATLLRSQSGSRSVGASQGNFSVTCVKHT